MALWVGQRPSPDVEDDRSHALAARLGHHRFVDVGPVDLLGTDHVADEPGEATVAAADVQQPLGTRALKGPNGSKQVANVPARAAPIQVVSGDPAQVIGTGNLSHMPPRPAPSPRHRRASGSRVAPGLTVAT